MVAHQLDLLGLEKEHPRGIQQEAPGHDRESDARGSGHGPYEHAAIEGPAPPAKLFPADFKRLLAPQIARLLVREQFRPIGFGGSRGRTTMHGFYALQTTTSCSRVTPNEFCTRSRTPAIRASMSFADALPTLTKKLA